MKKQNQKGITLVALIITIIVMMILVGVSVNIALGNGLFSATQGAAKKTGEEQANEIGLSEGKVTVGDTQYGSLDEYIDSLQDNENEMITISIRGITFTVNNKTQWADAIDDINAQFRENRMW